ncbi:MAG: phosphatidylglycerol lysyltransferase domain-containing protein [Treponema sp.]|nr:phosphatidylglycerol lysyltransferase domain-containing protein [Treponema sp.]
MGEFGIQLQLNERDRGVREKLLQQGFLPVGRETYPLFRDFKGGSILSELSPAVSTFWAGSFHELYRFIGGALVTVFFFDGMEPYFEINRLKEASPDAGGNAGIPLFSLRELVDALYPIALGAGLPSLRIYAVEESFLEEYKGIPGYETSVEYSDDHSEYVYRPADIVNLAGGINHKKHTHLNKFLGRDDIEIKPMNHDNRRLFLDIEREWCGFQDCAVCGAFAGCEYKALEIMADIYDHGYFQGLFGYVGGKVSGYLIWERREEGRAYLHFGKGLIQNFFAYLIYILAKDELGGAAPAGTPPLRPATVSLNLNEDMGKEGLRRFKKHLGIYEHWRKYLCTYKKCPA